MSMNYVEDMEDRERLLAITSQFKDCENPQVVYNLNIESPKALGRAADDVARIFNLEDHGQGPVPVSHQLPPPEKSGATALRYGMIALTWTFWGISFSFLAFMGLMIYAAASM